MKEFLLLSITFLLGIDFVFGQTEPPFVPHDFVVPQAYVSPDVFIVPLTTDLARLDYEAVMVSKEALRIQFGGEWPEDDFSLAQNMEDIAEHERLAQERKSFTYSLLDAKREKVLGCIYINPVDSAGYDAQVHMWIRSDQKTGTAEIKMKIQVWMATGWPFRKVVFW